MVPRECTIYSPVYLRTTFFINRRRNPQSLENDKFVQINKIYSNFLQNTACKLTQKKQMYLHLKSSEKKSFDQFCNPFFCMGETDLVASHSAQLLSFIGWQFELRWAIGQT